MTDSVRKLNQQSGDLLKGYKPANKDDDATPNYFGFVNQKGQWYILKEVVSAGADTYTYAIGNSGYTTAWTNRASLVYANYNTAINPPSITP